MTTTRPKLKENPFQQSGTLFHQTSHPRHGSAGIRRITPGNSHQQAETGNRSAHCCIYDDDDDIRRYLNIADRNLQLMQLLLQVGVFLSHLFVLGFPLLVRDFECLNLSLVVAGLDIGLAESMIT